MKLTGIARYLPAECGHRIASAVLAVALAASAVHAGASWETRSGPVRLGPGTGAPGGDAVAAAGGVIFADDFESGDLGAWSAVQSPAIFADGFEGGNLGAWSAALGPFVLAPVGDQVVPLGQTLHLTLSASGTSGLPILYGAEPLPLPPGAALNGSTGAFSFQPDASQVGTVSLTFTATDGVGSDSQSIDITVTDPGGPTAITGRVLDGNDAAGGTTTPIVGLTVSVLGSGVVTTTDGNGDFTLTGVPSGDQILDFDSSTAAPAPDGSPYAGYRKHVILLDGVTNVVERPVYLPRIDMASATTVVPDQTTFVVNPDLGITLEVPPFSAKNPDGTDFTGQLSISAVPDGFTPSQMPPELDPGLLITIQPVGVVFDIPAPITFPDVDGLAPGNAMDLWSLDPNQGAFAVVGLAEVQGDGTIDTISGGVRATDWHMALPPVASTSGSGDGDPECEGCCGPTTCPTGSEVTLKTGELTEKVALPSYVSQGQHRAVSLHYGSRRAHPTELVPAEVTIPAAQPVPPLISYRLRVGGVDQGDPIFVDTSVLDEDLDETIRFSVFYDAAHLPTGVYPSAVLTTNHFPASSVSANPRGRMVVVNDSDSAYGAGWSIGGLQRLYEQSDGTVLLVEGNGIARRFSRRFEPQDLSSWMEEINYPDGTFRPARWDLAPDNLSVTQAEPSAYALSTFISPFDFINGEMIVQMTNVDFDDDHIGLVLGYREPLVSEGDLEGDMSFILFDWKKLATSQFCGIAPEGSRLARIEGFVPPGDATCLFTTLEDQQARVLGTDLGPGRGWQGLTTHEVRVVYENSRIQLAIDGEQIFDVSGVFPRGRIGFYNFSQRDTEYQISFPTDATVLEGPPGDASIITRNLDGTFTRSLPDGTVVDFDAAGLMTAVTDRNGNVTSYSYDGGQRLTTITDPVGLETTFSYSSGLLASITDPAGRTTLFGHDADGNLTDVTYPGGATRSFGYDSDHRLVSQIDPRSFETTYEYDVFSRLVGSALPDGSERLTANVQEVGLVDTSGGLGTAANPAPIVRPDGAVSTFTDGEGRTASMDGDPFGQAAEITDTAGLVTHREYAAAGPQTRIETPSGHIQTATYDDLGNRLTVTDEELAGTFSFTYEPAFQQLATITDPFGMTTTISHDANGNPISVTTPEGRVDTFTYTAEGQLDTWVDRLGTTTDVTYDLGGQVEGIDQGTGPDQRTLAFTRTVEGYVDSVTDPEGRTTTYDYDAMGRPTSMTLPDGEVIANMWDGEHNPISVTPPGRPAHQLVFTDNGRLERYQPPAIGGATETLFTYDDSGQLTLIDRPDGRNVSLAYDAAGRLETRTITRGDTTFSYDPVTGLLASATAPGGEELAFSYQGDRMVGQAWSGTITGSTSRSFDAAERLASELVNGASQIVYTYDDDHLLTGAGALAVTRDAVTGLVSGSALGQVTDSWTYNDFGEVVGYQASFAATPLYAYTLTRDKLGRIVTESETVQGVTVDFDYTYDLRGRLERVEQNSLLAAEYSYDANSNRLSRDDGLSIETGTYDDQDRAMTYGGATYSYRQSGELLTHTAGGATTIYDYDELGNLLSVARPDGVVISYVIDGAERRVGKKIDGTLVQGFLYRDDLSPIAELDGTGNVVSRFVFGARDNVPDYMITGGATYRLISDQVGSVRLVVDVATGAVAQRLDYDEFGRVLLDTNPGFQPFGFAGGLYDPDSGLVRFGARDYDPQTGRWTAKDPILFAGAATNLYAYVDARPLDLIDPDGLTPGSSGADGSDDPIAFVVRINEGGYAFVRRANGSIERAYIDQRLFLGDTFITDRSTFAAFQYYTGGEIRVNKRTAACLTTDAGPPEVSPNPYDPPDPPSLWDRLPSMQRILTGDPGKPVHIRSSSGVLGGQRG